ncbi:NepR family anti-sigma factor [Methylobacterium sp. Leaf94]|uniref:NepR family anti-sigma factor n=1 Tax=Methylobacterium sp. Leaf94 TaxID=1736250 RepID=UPI0009EBF1F1|nr:NepR family anti-sigma factor [Methylobacterium sp. Leaf94]
MSTENQQKRITGGGSHEASHGELNAAVVSPFLPELVRDHLGRQLQAVYGSLTTEDQPQRLLDLIAQLDVALGRQGSQAASVFRQELLAALPGLRGFAMSLVVNPTRADDLVQETLLKAWKSQDRFEPGSNLMAWLCTIMRNQFYTECRKAKREVEDADGAAAAQLIVLPSQEHGIELQKVWAVLAKLPPAQREALLLVAGQGMTYEAAAALLGTQTGTMKSRVSRARAFLSDTLKASDDRTPA